MYRVLLADDEPIFLEFMQNIIDWEAFGCQIGACRRDGKSAMSYLEEARPQLAFLDISMPQADGLEVCQFVRERGIETRLIIMTGHDEFSFAYKAIKLGIDDYLLKPFSREELIQSVKKAVAALERHAEGGEERAFDRLEEGSTKYEIMSQAIDEYLRENYARSSLNLTVIAGDMGFESSYLRRVYKFTTGMTIMQRLEEIRITQAKHLLLSGKYQNQEISEMIGFSDPFYFSRRFKQLCGMTPSEYRSAGR